MRVLLYDNANITLVIILRSFRKKCQTDKISVLQHKQECSSVLHMAHAFTVGYPPPILVILEDEVVIFMYIAPIIQ